MSKRSKACEFNKEERQAIINRDQGCVFCKMGYLPSPCQGTRLSIAHYVSRAQGGLGLRQNGVLACQYHHNMMDNGNNGKRNEMLGIVKDYLKGIYDDWDEKDLVYNKWRY